MHVRHIAFVLTALLCGVAEPARAAERLTFKALAKMPYAVLAEDPPLHAGSNTFGGVKDPTASGGTCIRCTPKSSHWSVQWHIPPGTFAKGVKYSFYVRIRTRKTGGKGNALGFGAYDLSGRKHFLPNHLVPARAVPDMAWRVYKIGSFVIGDSCRWYVYAGISHENRENVPEAWVDGFVAVPEVTKENEKLLKANAESLRLARLRLERLHERLAEHSPAYSPQLTERFAFGSYLAQEQITGTARVFGDSFLRAFERAAEFHVRNYMDTICITNCTSDEKRLAPILDIAARYDIGIVPGAVVPIGASEEKIRAFYFRRVTRFRDNAHLLSWFMFDEPDTHLFAPLMTAKLAIDAISPGQSGILVLNNGPPIAKYGPHLPVVLTDVYPISGRKRNPWLIGPWVRKSCAVTGRPVWMIPQAVGAIKKKALKRPTAGEFRLMTYSALANGATGFLYYHYMHRPVWAMDRYVDPRYHGGIERENLVNSFEAPDPVMMPEAKRIGRRLSAVGPLMVGATFAGTEGIEINSRKVAIVGGKTLPALAATVLKKKDDTFVVPWNNDPSKAVVGRIKLGKLLTGGKRLYDLFSLGEAKMKNNSLMLKLEPGDGRVYLAATQERWLLAKRKILAKRWEKERAIFKLDLGLAQKSGLEIARVESRLKAADSQAASGLHEKALDALTECGKMLEAVRRSEPTFAAVRGDLKAVQDILGCLEEMLQQEDFFFNDAVRERGRVHLKKAGTLYFSLLERFRRGRWREAAKEIGTLMTLVNGLEGKIFEKKAGSLSDPKGPSEYERKCGECNPDKWL